MATTNQFDAIVVGSGMSGGWAAKELTEKGLKTLVLERGRNIRHVTDYTTALKDPWQLPHNNRPTNADRAAQPIQSTLYLYDQSTKQHLRRRSASIPTSRRSRSTGIAAIRSAAGRSCGRGMCSATAISISRPTSSEGVGIDWPIRYADIAPWYEHVEKFIGASGENPGLPQLPKQILQPPFEMTALEKHVKSALRRRSSPTANSSAARSAVLSREHNGRGPARDAINARAAVRSARTSRRTA